VVYTADSVRKFDSKSNRTADLIRDSIRTQKNDSQVPNFSGRFHMNLANWFPTSLSPLVQVVLEASMGISDRLRQIVIIGEMAFLSSEPTVS